MISKIKQEEVVDKFVLYYHSSERANDIWTRLSKIDKYCQNWMHNDLVHQLKMELFVQEIENSYIDDPEPQSKTQLDPY